MHVECKVALNLNHLILFCPLTQATPSQYTSLLFFIIARTGFSGI